MQSESFRKSRILLMFAIAVFFAAGALPATQAVERYTGHVRSEKVHRLAENKSLSKQKLPKSKSTKLNPYGKGDAKAIKGYRLPSEHYGSSFKRRKR